jgi:hypothetical protein
MISVDEAQARLLAASGVMPAHVQNHAKAAQGTSAYLSCQK